MAELHLAPATDGGIEGMEHDELLTAEQGRRRLGVGYATFWGLVKRRGVPQYRAPAPPGQRGLSLFRAEDLERLRRTADRLPESARDRR
jgi:hypothetical protein